MADFANSKLAKSLCLLDAVDTKSFGKWLSSPWCNSNKVLLRFYNSLQVYHPSYDAPRCKKEILYRRVYPGKAYNSKQMRWLMAELSKQVEQFLIQQQLRKDPIQQKLLLQEAFLQRHQTDWFEKLSRQTIEELSAKTNKSWIDLLHLSLLHEGLYFQPDTTVRHQPEQRDLQNASDHLDAFYALGKYRFFFEFEERKKIIKGEQGIPEDLELLHLLKDRVSHPTVGLYDHYVTQEYPLPLDDYQPLRDRTLKHLDLLSWRDQRDFLYALINKASRLFTKGNTEMQQEIMELYQIGLERNLLIAKGRITDRTFNNIVSIYNSLAKYDLALEFSQNYASFLRPDYQQDALIWARAHTYYHSGNYESAVDQMSNHSFSVYLYELHGRMLLLQSYFDLFKTDSSYQDYFFHYSNAFEKFIRRGKFFNEAQKKIYLFFLVNTKKLATMISKNQIDEFSLDQYSKSLNAPTRGHGRFWLNKKIAELKKV